MLRCCVLLLVVAVFLSSCSFVKNNNRHTHPFNACRHAVTHHHPYVNLNHGHAYAPCKQALHHRHVVNNGKVLSHSHASFCYGNLRHMHQSNNGKATAYGQPFILKRKSDKQFRIDLPACY